MLVDEPYVPELIIAFEQQRSQIKKRPDGSLWVPVSLGGRRWGILIAQTQGWVTLCTVLGPIAAIDNELLVVLVAENGGHGACRFAADDRRLMFCAEFPVSMEIEAFLDFARLYRSALELVVQEVLPELTGAPHVTAEDAVAMSKETASALAMYRDHFGWTSPWGGQPLVKSNVGGVAMQLRLDNPHVVTISSALAPIRAPVSRSSMEHLLRWQAPNKVVKVTLSHDDEPLVVATWPRIILEPGFLEFLQKEVAATVKDLESELAKICAPSN